MARAACLALVGLPLPTPREASLGKVQETSVTASKSTFGLTVVKALPKLSVMILEGILYYLD